MKEKMRKFLKILRVELEDLEEDMELLIDLHREKEQKRVITPYVCMENIGLIKNEISAVKRIIGSIENVGIDEYNNIEELTEHINNIFKKQIKESDYPDSIYFFVKRKLDKVKKYIEER